MRKWILFWLIFVFAFTPLITEAQYYNLTFRNYSSFNGLSQSEVQCVYEDRSGFLWIGTWYGLTLYDGREFTTYYHRVNDPSSLGGNLITDIAQDRKGVLWFSVYNSGISKMDPLNKKFRNYQPSGKKNSILSEKVNTLMIDSADRVWIGSAEGLSIYDSEKDKFYNLVFESDKKKSLSVNCIERDKLGNIWVGAETRIYYSKEDARIRPIWTNIELKGINAFQFDGENKGWVATDEGLYSFVMSGIDSISLTRASFFKENIAVKDIEFDGHGNLWIGNRTKGLAIYFPATGFFDVLREDYTSSRGLLSNRLIDLYYDNSGGMWVSGENGLQSFHNAAQRFNIYPGLSNVSDRVRGSTIYGLNVEDNLFLLATSGGVILYNRVNSNYLPVTSKHELVGTPIRYRDVQRENENTWWVTTDHGLFELVRNNDQFILRRPVLINDKDIRTVGLRNYLKDGNIYWFGTTHKGLIRYDILTKQKDWYQHEEGNARSLPDEVINKVAFDRDGNVLVGHDYGLSILYKGARDFESFIYGEGSGKGLSNRYVYDMFDDGSKIWIGTFGGGINVLDKKTKKIVYLTTSNGLCDDAIYTITPESDSVLWLGTNKGLSRLDTRTGKFRNFEKNDGMPSEEFNMLSAYRSKQGEIFMGTVGGVISFFPSALTKNILLPGVYLTRVRKNGTYLNDSSTTLINRDRKIVTRFGEDLFLEFSPMTFYGVSKPELTYNIREQGDTWSAGEAGGLLPLVKFEPGVYTIDVRIKNYSGSESSKVWTLSFTVLPPFWKTVGFRIFVFLLLLMILYLVVRQIIKRRLERQRAEFLKQQAVEQERSRISEELHDDIGGGLTAIRLLSEMSLVHDTDHPTSKYLQKISSSSNELIQKMNEIVWALNVNNDNLQSLIAYTRQYAVSYLDDLNISCNFETPENIPNIIVNGKNRRSVFLLVKESLNNVVKHAHASNVNIHIEIDISLNINIADNGKGIQDDQLRNGNGLGNMQKRIRAMKGNMDIKNGVGTTLLFNIPLKSLNT